MPPPNVVTPIRADGPTQDKPDDAPGPDTSQSDTEDEDDSSEIRQILEGQKAGEFDFDRDFGNIKDEDQFERLLWEYERMNDKPNGGTDFPRGTKPQMKYARRIGEAMCNMTLATDTKCKDRKSANKSNADGPDSEQASGNGHEPAEKDSVAVTFLKSLKPGEIELISWKVMIFARDAQEGRLSRATFGVPKTEIAKFDSWTSRISASVECLKESKIVARQIIRDGDQRIKDFVANPKAETKKVMRNRVYNTKRRDKKDAADQAKLLAPARSHDKSTPEALDSDRTEDSGNQQNDAGSNSTSTEKRKQPSTLRQAHVARQGNAQPAISNLVKESPAPLGGGKKPTGLSAPGLEKTSSQGGPPGPGDMTLVDVAQPNSLGRNGPATSTTTPNGPSTCKDGSLVPIRVSSTATSGPTSHNAGNNHKGAWRSSIGSIDQQAITKFHSRAQQQPNPDVSNVPESVGKEFSPPALPTRPLSNDNQGPGQSSRAPTAGLSAVAGPPSSATQSLPPAARKRLPDSRPSPVGGSSSLSGTFASLGTPSLEKKRQRLSPQGEEDPRLSTRSTTAERANKRQKRDSTGDGTHADPYYLEPEEDDDDDYDYEEDDDED
uniref:Uncharacterized protein n=1 Tax=Gnomonia sp. TaxID=2011790 RepID=A0AAU8CHL9_9PEZI